MRHLIRKLLSPVKQVKHRTKQEGEDHARHIEKEQEHLERELRVLKTQVTLNRLRKGKHAQ